ELSAQDATDRRRAPARWSLRRRSGTRRVDGVQRLRNATVTPAAGVTVKNLPDYGGLRLVDDPRHVRLLAARGQDRLIVVAEHEASGDVALARFPLHGVVGTLAGLFALEFVG